jgi:hypothetical protein
MPPIPPWGIDAELLIELDPPTGATHAVKGLAGFASARVAIVAAGDDGARRVLRLRPLVTPPGPFDDRGILMFAPFLETDPDPTRAALREFETRIGARYYEFLLGQRFRYAATCVVAADGIPSPGTCAELYAIDAPSIEEAEALDAAAETPADILAIYAECRNFIVKDSHRQVYLVPLVEGEGGLIRMSEGGR